ncbi:hypothetical protein [Actinoplanes sp. NPDC049802]|uniref:hypothetical protein n=1 Tax=Actinoplanes sp. NPDC049802 TaxID=3154742 RepID=UPI0033EB410B
MDVDEASKALAEMRKRQEQTLRRGNPRKLPGWFIYGMAASLTLVWSSGDLSGWAALAVIAAGLGTTFLLARRLERVTGVRVRGRELRMMPLVLLTGAMVVTAILVGSVLRLFDVPADSTLAGLASAVVWIAGVGRAQAAAATPRERA